MWKTNILTTSFRCTNECFGRPAEPAKRRKTFIDVNITGLQNLLDTALLALINMTIGVVVMLPSNTIVIPLSPDSVGSGTFNKRVDIPSLRTGTFSVNVKLDLPGDQPIIQREPDPPPFHLDQKPLDKPRRLESKALQIGLNVGIKKLVAVAGGARGQEWNIVCDKCRQCIEARMGTWAADMVKKLGEGIIKEFEGKAVDLIGKGIQAVGLLRNFLIKCLKTWIMQKSWPRILKIKSVLVSNRSWTSNRNFTRKARLA